MEKPCYKCKVIQPLTAFGKLASSKDGHRYDCGGCRKAYRLENKKHIAEKNSKYYAENVEKFSIASKQYRETHIVEIYEQRKSYRNRPDKKVHIANKNREYLPIRKESIKRKRKEDPDYRLQEILRSKIHKMINTERESTSYADLIGCDVNFLRSWLEFRFDETMSWQNLGDVWQIDHILPISRFHFDNDHDKRVCFHWTNLQPLASFENRSKSNKLQLHYFFNNIVNINRFHKNGNNQYLGYQAVGESLRWLRATTSGMVKTPLDEGRKMRPEIGNPQPSP
jgi:hypothetical protein